MHSSKTVIKPTVLVVEKWRRVVLRLIKNMSSEIHMGQKAEWADGWMQQQTDKTNGRDGSWKHRERESAVPLTSLELIG